MRALSFWGWGFADLFPDREARAGLASQVGGMLGFSGLEPRDPARLEEVELPKARLPVPSTLAGVVRADAEDRIRHTYGRAYRDVVRGFEGDFRAAPDLVAHPRTEGDVGRVLAWASDARVAVIPFGGGTSVVGGVEPERGPGHQACLSLDLRGLGRVLEIDERSLAARIEAGATGPGLEAQLGARGLTLRFFPQSFEHSTLGGWIATRAAGHFAMGPTHIDDLVESTRTLTPRGVLETRRLPGSGAGPSPDRLVLGSEGALGVITEAWMRVRPRPRFRSTASVRFARFDQAVEAVRALSQSGLRPANARLLDAREAALNGVCTDGSCVLLLGFESADHPQELPMARAIELATTHGGACPDGPSHGSRGDRGAEGASGSWKASFVHAPYLQNVMVSLGVIADTFETAVTWDRFEALHAAVVREVRAAMKSACGRGTITCRLTHVYPDGPAPYFTFLAPARRGAELAQWAQIKAAASEAVLASGGTITHHHGVGRTHRPWYERQRPALFGEVLSAAKRALDPEGILNPGCLLAPRP